MPFGKKAQCNKCERQESFMWHPAEEGVQCNECLESDQLALKAKEEEEQKPPAATEKSKSSAKKNTRNTRSYKTRQNPNAIPKQVTPKGKGRRQAFKKVPPIKLHAAPSTYTTVSSVFYKGFFYRVGDIVSIIGSDDGRTYYAQISCLMIDEYCEKSASITWLFPTRSARDKPFDPIDYVIGYNDDLPRRLECMEFVMHLPVEYFRNYHPFPSTLSHSRLVSFIWGRLSHMI